jgi:ketosteroid isomerase-like protein
MSRGHGGPPEVALWTKSTPFADTGAVSQANVELVRQAYAAVSRGDRKALRALLPEEFVADFSRRQMDGFVLPRDEAIATFFTQTGEVWEGLPTWEPQELIDTAEKVVARIRVAARGQIGGVETETLVWNVWTFREAEPVAVTYFGEDRAAAHADAGL